MTRFEHSFVWTGGVLFVASLGYCAHSYLIRWSDGAAGGGWAAAAFDAVLLSIFALHHSVLARQRPKQWLMRQVRERLLRSLYVWTASLLLLVTCAAWQPIGGELFRAGGVRVWLHVSVQLAGAWMVAQAVRGLDPLELAGIRPPSTVQGPRVVGPYHLVRHPLYLGWVLIVFGAAHMTADRLAFAALTTLYLVIAIPWEERSLAATFGEDYERYKALVRWRLIPFIY